MEILLGVLFVGFGITVAVLRNLKSTDAWQEAAAACGLQVTDASTLGAARLTGRAGEVEVRIESSADESRPTRISVAAPAPPDFYRITLRPESMFRFVPEILIGETRFDNEFSIEGPVQLVSALLDIKMRHLLIDPVFESRLEVSSGEIAVNVTDENVSTALRVLLDIGRRIAEPLDIPRRLAENARQDPAPGVRLHNLLVLIRELPKHPVTAEALRQACSDSSPAIRLRAAQELGDKGILLELAESMEDDDASAAAVSTLGQELPVERLAAILESAVRRERLQTARVAAQALGATGNPAAEPPLIEAHQWDEPQVRLAAAAALGRVGTAMAVLPLKEAGEGSWRDLDIRRAARQAIAEIQARLQGASPGQLSLAETEAGQLSLAEDPSGKLSLPQD